MQGPLKLSEFVFLDGVIRIVNEEKSLEIVMQRKKLELQFILFNKKSLCEDVFRGLYEEMLLLLMYEYDKSKVRAVRIVFLRCANGIRKMIDLFYYFILI